MTGRGVPKLLPASELLDQKSKEPVVQLFCQLLNGFVGPCLRPGNLIEIAGEAGSGKTQLGLQICVCAAVPRNLFPNSVAVFIATEGEGPFPSSRLEEMVTGSGIANSSRIMDKIIVESVKDEDQLLNVLKIRLDAISRKYLITIVVLDSVAGILRAENEANDRLKRSKQIHKIGFELSNAARKHKTPFVVINQVTAYLDQSVKSYGRANVPCFGLPFANYVHTRIFLERTDAVIQETNNQDTPAGVPRLRTCTIDFSPVVAPGKVNFIVQKAGIRGVNVIG